VGGGGVAGGRTSRKDGPARGEGQRIFDSHFLQTGDVMTRKGESFKNKRQKKGKNESGCKELDGTRLGGNKCFLV